MTDKTTHVPHDEKTTETQTEPFMEDAGVGGFNDDFGSGSSPSGGGPGGDSVSRSPLYGKDEPKQPR